MIEEEAEIKLKQERKVFQQVGSLHIIIYNLSQGKVAKQKASLVSVIRQEARDARMVI